MKRTWKSLLSLLLVAAMCMSFASPVFAAEVTEKFTVAGTNMNLGNELSLNFMFTKSLPAGKTYTAVITQSSDGATVATTNVPQADWESFNSSLYKVNIPVRAMELADELKLEIVDEEGTVYNNEYITSARAYSAKALVAASSTDLMKTLVVDMLNYGAEAQKNFGYNTGDLANSLLTEEQQALASEPVECTDLRIKGENYQGSNLALENRIELNLFFKNVTTDMYAEVSYTDFLGQLQTVTVPGMQFGHYSGTIYKVPVDSLVLADAKSLVTVTVYKADGTIHGTGADCVESYIARAAASDLNSAIMKFANSAYLYLAEKNGIAIDGTCKVTFVDHDGTILSVQNVQKGSGAAVPAEPSRDGYCFTGWSGNWENVTSNVTVKATYAANNAANLFTIDPQFDEEAKLLIATVALGGTVKLTGFDVSLVYDAGKLEFVSADSDLSLDVLTKHYANEARVRAMLMAGQNTTQGGDIMKVVFRVKDGAEGLAHLAIEPSTVITAGSNGSFVSADFAACHSYVEVSHNWDEGVVTTAPTCEAEGVKTYTCLSCGEHKEEPVAKTSHAYGAWTESGDDHIHTCTSCGNTESEAHKWDGGVESESEITYTCTVCNAVKTEEVSEHTWNAGELTRAATDTEEGEVLYTCLDADCGETKTETIPAGTVLYTRADLELAIEELSWDYLLKKDKIQYDSMELDAMGKYYSGKYLVTEGAAPEYGTSHTEINSVCSDYVWKVYEEALHHNLLGGKSSLEAVTTDLWNQAENQYVHSDEEDIDSTVVRWQTLAFTDLEKQYGVPDSPHFVDTKEEVFEYFLNWQTMLRPGDVLVDKGHALIYAGNGKVLHCNGTKYQPSDNTLNHEDSGSVNGVSPLSCTDTSWLETRAKSGRLIVFRPTEFLVAKDTDGNLGNDIVRDPNFVMPADTVSRLEYPGMEIDRTVDITPFGTASVGQELTYSVKISNLSSDSKYLAAKQVADRSYAGVDYEDLIVIETVPEGTNLVEDSITEGGVYDAKTNTITWTLSIKAGKSVTPAYSVIVTGSIGDSIVNDGGYVANIPSNRIENCVGGVKLNEFAETTLLDMAAGDTTDWAFGTDLTFAEKLYEAAETALTLPTVSEIVDALFVWTNTLGEIRSPRYLTGKANVDVFMLREDVEEEYLAIRDMIINTYYGGYRFFTGSDAIGSTISEFRLAYLESGDIIVNADTSAGAVTSAQVAVYAGNDTLLICNADGTYSILRGTAAKLQLWKSFLASNDLFFALRPSQAADLKAAHTWDEGVVSVEPTCGSEGEMLYTCLDDGCGATKTKVLEKTTEHNWADDAEDNGNGTHTATCSDCGESKTSAHVWDDGVTDEGDGSKKLFTCEVCGTTKTEFAGLTAAQIKTLQALTYYNGSMAAGANSRQRPLHFADTIYEALGIDGFVETYNGSLTAAAALSQPFCRLDSNGSVYGANDREYVLRTYANGYIVVDGAVRETANMIVDNFYGGSWLVDADGDRLTNAAASMNMDDLQPGDVIVLGENTASFTALLWTVVYQGEIDGQDVFLFGNTYYGSYTNVPATTSYRGRLCFNAGTGILEDAEFTNSISSTGTEVKVTMDAQIGSFTFNDFLMSDPVSGINWEYFYALRPCKVLGVGK
ncbi:MAG: InlB B-repeat-containing protein [Oscillospiraceae bacterium]|nr:InlB B-repeat-containing protein [Oscillospiraceae bacterium]